MGQRTTFGDHPADEMSRAAPSSEWAAESDGSAANTLELLRTLARKSESEKALELLRSLAHKSESGFEPENPLELLRSLARRHDDGDPMNRTLDLLRNLARRGDGAGRAAHDAQITAAAASISLRTLAGTAARLKEDAHGAGLRWPAAHVERAWQMALIAIAGAAVFLAAAGAAFLLSRGADRASELHRQIVAPIATPSEPAASSTMDAEAALQSVQTAMAECDQQAQRDPDTLYLLVIPIVPAGDAFRLSAEMKEEYDSFTLVTSKSMLAGLQDGSFALNARPFRFAIIDSATGKTQIWSTATGVSKFTHRDAAAFSKFRLGFDIPDKGPQWSNEYPRNAGVCYWVNVRFHWG
jgi:hypothetical protein